MSNVSFLYLSRQDVEKVALDIPTIIDLLEKAFREKGEGKVELPPKLGIHTQPNAFIHAMPAYIPSLHAAGVKWVGGYPDNPKRGLPYISGLLILNDEESGLPYAVMDCTWITAYRTGAASALSAKYLARPDSKTLGIIGCGVQGRTHTEAMTTMFPIERIYAYDILPSAQEKFIAEMGAKFPKIEFVPASHPKEVVIRSEIVVTAGPILKNPSPTIEKDWLQPGAFATALDYDSYWKGEALQQIDKFTTDDLAQMETYRTLGYFKETPQPHADLGEIVAGKKPGRQFPTERSMAMNLGLALDDMAVAPTIYQKAKEMGLGVWLPL